MRMATTGNKRDVEPGMHTDLRGTTSYNSYLHLDELLSLIHISEPTRPY